MLKLRDCHKGQRCFIIGNGPSLRQTDLSLLKGEVTFGLNRIYLLFPELGFKTTYLVSVNDLVLEQCAEEIKALEMPKFITWRARRWLSKDPHTIFVDTDYTGPENFTREASGRVFEGFTVTYVALQLAFYMGFQEVILVGVDHNFV
ncbi:MAG TPA: 6-hydroxymethylpterin diphosphokinase MptE-like protein, partial [Anaerolineales bacterium]